MQQITLCSYCLYFIVAVESMITSQICRLHARKRSWQSLVTTANGGGLAHAPSGTLGGMSRLNSSAIGMVGPSSSNLVMVDSDGGMAKANGLTVATAGGAALGARTLKRQTSSMRSDRDTTPSSAMGSQHQQQQQGVRHTITEETSLDVTAPDALAPPQQYSPRASSHGGGAHVTSSSSGAHAHVQLEVVELGGGAKQQQRTSVGPMFARAGPAGEASEQQPSSADEGLPPCPPPASASRGLRHRAGAWARKGRGRCIPCSGESTQDDDGVVAPPGALEPCETLGPAATGKRARRRSSLDGIPQALTRCGAGVEGGGGHHLCVVCGTGRSHAVWRSTPWRRAGSTVAMKSREIRGRIDADEAYAQLVSQGHARAPSAALARQTMAAMNPTCTPSLPPARLPACLRAVCRAPGPDLLVDAARVLHRGGRCVALHQPAGARPRPWVQGLGVGSGRGGNENPQGRAVLC